jgi:hypothetical protein
MPALEDGTGSWKGTMAPVDEVNLELWEELMRLVATVERVRPPEVTVDEDPVCRELEDGPRMVELEL